MTSRLLLLSLICVAFTGCESVRNDIGGGVREKWSGPTYQRQVFDGEAQAVFDAAKSAVEQLGFRVTRAGAAQMVIDGVSGLASDDRFRGSRQRAVKVRLAKSLDSKVEVAVLFTEVVEDDFGKGPGQAAEVALRNHPLYEAFFAATAAGLSR